VGVEANETVDFFFLSFVGYHPLHNMLLLITHAFKARAKERANIGSNGQTAKTLEVTRLRVHGPRPRQQYQNIAISLSLIIYTGSRIDARECVCVII